MANIHRVYLPSPLEEGDGILVDAEWNFTEKQEYEVDKLKVYFILNGEIGNDVSNSIDLSIYLVLARKVIEELELLLQDGSEY